MRICLFEDHGVAALEPLTLTRPAFDLLCGLAPLSAKQTRYFSPCLPGALVRPSLADLVRHRCPDLAVNDADWLGQGFVVLVNGRWLPPDGLRPEFQAPCVGMVEGEVAFAAVTPQMMTGLSPATVDECLEDWKHNLVRCEAGGALIARPWDLVEHNGTEIGRDFRARGDRGTSARPMNFSLVGPAGQLGIDPSAHIDPLVVADTTGGPVVIDRDAVVTAFTRLEGPCYVGPGTHVLGARIRAGTTLGPYCRVGGEVEASIMQGFSNKYHDGFLGHSYVGEWVNMGAGVQTSDLRHDYGEVVVAQGGLRVPTGSSKVGSFIGDHAKIAIGALLNTGTNLGAFTSVLPAGRLLPRYVPSFCRVAYGTLGENDDVDELFATAREVMRRRGVELSDAHLDVYRGVFEQTAAQRRLTIHEADQPRLRRSA